MQVCVCASVHTHVDGVCIPADLSLCPAPVDTSGVPTAPPEHAPRTGSSPWHPRAWSGCLGDLDWCRQVGACGGVPRGAGPIRAPGWGLPEDGEVLPSSQETPPPQSRSRWEASGSPRLAVIHAGCAGAFTAEQRPAPRGAGRSGEASGSPGLLDCSCLLRGSPLCQCLSLNKPFLLYYHLLLNVFLPKAKDPALATV